MTKTSRPLLKRRLASVLVITLTIVLPVLGTVELASAAPPTAPVWGFVWSNQTSPPLNWHYAPSADYQNGSWRANPVTTSASVTIVRNAIGQYTVVFPFIGIPRPNSQASTAGIALATGYGYAGASCHADMWLESDSSATNELVVVSCRDRTGNPVDSQFTAMFTNAGTAVAPAGTAYSYLAYIWNWSPAAREWPINQYNSDGQRGYVDRLGVGFYQVHLPGPSFTAVGGHVQINALHTDEPNGTRPNCVVTWWYPSGDGQNVHVVCTRGGVPAESKFALVYSRNRSIMSHLVQGFVWSPNGDFGEVPANSWYSANSFGRTNTINHYATGRYVVRFPGVGRLPDHVQVTPYGDINRYCTVNQWSSAWGSWGDALVYVDCYDSVGQLTDSAFDVAYLSGTPFIS
jgi:hypothetical protein